MKFSLPNPINATQQQFAELCEKGGGRGGGPPRGKVQDLLHQSGRQLNKLAEDEITQALHEFSDRDPWKICFSVGLCWGHLARFDLTFIDAATRLLDEWNADDVRVARQFHFERGPEPIEQSLKGGNDLFSRVTLPDALPDNLERYRRAQDRWLSPILSSTRPKYIGSWNATALFMIALFSNPPLAAGLTTPVVSLPPGGPIFAALTILFKTHVLSRAPAGSELDDGAFEPGAIYENNALFEELHKGHLGWNLLDVHSGLYMLGTRLPDSANWF